MKPKPSSEPILKLECELELADDGYACVAGIDEAGRGAWAGPVTAAAVVLPITDLGLPDRLAGVRDSKRLSPSQRNRWEQRLRGLALAMGVGTASSREVDDLGLIAATRAAMQRAVSALDLIPQYLLIDHLLLPDLPIPQTAITRGDDQVLSIAAASIIAKTSRDREMAILDELHPGYGFALHKGYGTSLHRKALALLGPCSSHRMSYTPVANQVGLDQPLQARQKTN